MHDNQRGVSIKEVEDAVQRSLESAEWAKQMDDARALTCLKSFLTSTNAKSLLYVHLVALQPELFGDQEDDTLKRIPMHTVCELFEEALNGANTSDIIDVKYSGMTSLGSAKYQLISCINPAITVYIRLCRGNLRAEVKEDNFLHKRPAVREAQPIKPKGITSFIKRLLSFP